MFSLSSFLVGVLVPFIVAEIRWVYRHFFRNYFSLGISSSRSLPKLEFYLDNFLLNTTTFTVTNVGNVRVSGFKVYTYEFFNNMYHFTSVNTGRSLYAYAIQNNSKNYSECLQLELHDFKEFFERASKSLSSGLFLEYRDENGVIYGHQLYCGTEQGVYPQIMVRLRRRLPVFRKSFSLSRQVLEIRYRITLPLG